MELPNQITMDNSIYRWVQCKEKTPDTKAAYRDIWINPHDKEYKEWMYFNGAIDEYDQVYDIDSTVTPNQDTVEWLCKVEADQLSQSKIDELQKEVEEKDNFAISFAVWCMYDPYAKEIQASGATAGELLRRYKDHPYINPDSSQQ